MSRMTIDEIYAFLETAFPRAREFSAITALGERDITVQMPFRPSYLRPGNTLSGPTLMTLADTAAFFLVLAQRGPLALAVTSSLDIHFLSKPPAADLLATATVLKLGKRLLVARVDIRGAAAPDGDLLAQATVTYALPAS
jgi:uncharacterized protein (TIGR00369 family)